MIRVTRCASMERSETNATPAVAIGTDGEFSNVHQAIRVFRAVAPQFHDEIVADFLGRHFHPTRQAPEQRLEPEQARGHFSQQIPMAVSTTQVRELVNQHVAK